MSNGVTAWSYSRFSDYQQCPLKFKLKHIDKIKEPGSPAMQRGSDIHKQGENYLLSKGKAKVPEAYVHFASEMKQLKTLDPLVEQQWGFTKAWQPATSSGRDQHGWFAHDTYLRIVTDVSVVYDDNTADIIDFKTGKMYGTNQDQMDLFSTGPFMKFPNLELVTTRLWYLDIPDPANDGSNTVVQEFTRDDFERIKKEWDKRIRPMFMDKKFPPKPNPKCRWCHFRKENGGPCKY
jgi:CRISPR/Cas system-associated exonuclease Cas4 (RecB family)